MEDCDIQKKTEAITELYKQMETAQSLTLKNLLATEINAYITLSDVFIEYVKVHTKYMELLDDEFVKFGELIEKQSEQSQEFLKQWQEQKEQRLKISEDLDEWTDSLQVLENISIRSELDSLRRCKEISHSMFAAKQIQYSIFKNFCDWYLFVIGRDDRDWGKLFGELGKFAAKHVVEAIPAISEAVGITNAAMELIDVVDKYDHIVPDYCETDGQLAAIEKHIQVIEELTQHLNEYTERLKAGLKVD